MAKTALGRPATGLGRYYMDCGWYRHKKYAGLPIEALFLVEAGVGYCTEHGLDGLMTADLEQLSLDLGVRLAAVKKGAKALLERGVWRQEDGELIVVGYADHNPTRAEMDEYLEAKSQSGVAGNHVRWHVGRGVIADGCPLCESPPAPDEPPPEDRMCDPGCDGEPIAESSHGKDGMGRKDGKEGSSSESGSTTTEPPIPDDDSFVWAVCELLARRDLAQRQQDKPGSIVFDEDRWLSRAAKRRHVVDSVAIGHLAAELVQRRPGVAATPAEVAERFLAGRASPAVVSSPMDGAQRAQMARMTAERRDEGPDAPDPGLNVDMTRAARAALRGEPADG